MNQGYETPVREICAESTGDHVHFDVNLGGGDWGTSIDIETGGCFCNCPSFFFKKGLKSDIDIAEIKYQCKHIKAAINDLMNRGVLTVDDLVGRRKK